jgi:hypothetical protein
VRARGGAIRVAPAHVAGWTAVASRAWRRVWASLTASSFAQKETASSALNDAGNDSGGTVRTGALQAAGGALTCGREDDAFARERALDLLARLVDAPLHRGEGGMDRFGDLAV